jgi:hypothetical protein
MFCKTIFCKVKITFCKTTPARCALLAVAVVSGAALGQPTPSATRPSSSSSSSDSLSLELPVTMRQNVTAGTTVIGTKIQAKLSVATLVNGVVIPSDAILSGEVTESAAKSLIAPSRLAIRIDSARWKNGSARLQVYLTAWSYATSALTTQDSSYTPLDSTTNPRRRNRGGVYPNPTLNPQGTIPASDPYPGRDPGSDSTPSPLPESNTPKHRVLMKDVESVRNSDGTVTITSKRFNIKLNRQMTYVLASGDLLPLK